MRYFILVYHILPIEFPIYVKVDFLLGKVDGILLINVRASKLLLRTEVLIKPTERGSNGLRFMNNE